MYNKPTNLYLFLHKIINMTKESMVYDTKTGRTFAIHPDLLKDPVYLQSHGWIVQHAPKPIEVTNLVKPEPAPETPTKSNKPKS